MSTAFHRPETTRAIRDVTQENAHTNSFTQAYNAPASDTDLAVLVVAMHVLDVAILIDVTARVSHDVRT